MKRKCKNIDITNYDFIRSSVTDCLAHKRNRQMNRKDIKTIFEKYNDVDGVAAMIQSELINRKLDLDPIRYKTIIDRGNGKERNIAIEGIHQQFLDYVASHALMQGIGSYIGHYQIACRKGCGSIMASHLVQNWIKDKKSRYCIKADLRHCYESITHADMEKWLKKHVNNEPLLWLTHQLLGTVREGLPIGSMLSITLSALYIADLYHHIEDHYFLTRRGKKTHVIAHQLFYLDDIYLFGSNAKELHKAMKDIVVYASSMGLTIKPDWITICLNKTAVPVLGYRVREDRITMVRKNYLAVKKSLRKFKREPNDKNARSLNSYWGMLKYSNSKKFCEKYNVYAVMRSARKVVSLHDKGKFYGQTAGSKNHEN